MQSMAAGKLIVGDIFYSIRFTPNVYEVESVAFTIVKGKLYCQHVCGAPARILCAPGEVVKLLGEDQVRDHESHRGRHNRW